MHDCKHLKLNKSVADISANVPTVDAEEEEDTVTLIETLKFSRKKQDG
jgi:hypothetical protein